MKVSVLGCGSFGTTLAILLNDNNHEVICWSIEHDVINEINTRHTNEKFLPGIQIPEKIRFTTDLSECFKNSGVVVIAIPSQAVRSVLEKIEKNSIDNRIWISVAKGIENKTLLRVSQVINNVLNIPEEQICVLSGPSHAEEVSRKMATLVVAASSSLDTAQLVQNLFMTSYFRVYASTDVAGVEYGGALKNIVAVAAGICDGVGLGDNSKAALITRGLVEINRLGVRLGAQPDTFAGLSGIGDLVVTCMSRHSRNRYVGEQIGKGRSLQDILAEMSMVAEGVKTTQSAYELACNLKVEMPITEQVYKVLFENKSAVKALEHLMTRESKIEDWG